MWFIFPQIKGLGHSELASVFAISSRREAEAYLNHTILGPRLRECSQLVNNVEGRSIEQMVTRRSGIVAGLNVPSRTRACQREGRLTALR
jgi:uncharacterized protein (DUF1810 family)